MRKTFITLIIFALLINCGCQKKTDKIMLSEYNTPYTTAYDNKDGTYSFYIYASPIFLKEEDKLIAIDNAFVKSSKEGFAFENKANIVKTYFPQRLSDYIAMEKETDSMSIKLNIDSFSEFKDAKIIDYTNMYGDKVSAVIYEGSKIDYVFYPTKSGVESEIVIKEKPIENLWTFSLILTNTTIEDRDNGYVILKKGGTNLGIIYSPIVKGGKLSYNESDNNFSIDNGLQIIQDDGGYSVSLNMNEKLFNSDIEYPVKISTPFEFYLNCMPDTGVFSGQSSKNAYLLNYSPIGITDKWGENYQYIRLRLNYFIETLAKDIVSAKYYVKELSGFDSEIDICLYQANENWSSTGMTWNDKIEYDKIVSSKSVKQGGLIEFDITNFAKDCVRDENGTRESAGFVMKSDSPAGYRVFASHDNRLNAPYCVITLNKLPYFFEPHENINPPVGS